MSMVDDSLHQSTPTKRNMIMSSVQRAPQPSNAKSSIATFDLTDSFPQTTLPTSMVADVAKNTTNSKRSRTATEESKAETPQKRFKPNIELPKVTEKIIPHPEPTRPNIALDVDTKPELKNNPEHKVAEAPEIQEPGVLYQPKSFIHDDPAVLAFNFEEASLANLLSYMESVHHIKFINDDIVSTAKDAKGLAGHKITFRTNRTLTKKESWDLSITFLHIAGFDVLPLTQQGFYRLVPLTKANNEPVPTYIGVDSQILPDNDMIVRYIYFVRNLDPVKIKPILSSMQSGAGKIDIYQELKAFIFTDRASSIKALVKIVSELDRAVLPEVLSVVKLKRANAKDVIDLYNSLKPASAGQPQKAWAPNKKDNTLDYFPSDVIMVSDPRTNTLILLGTTKEIARVEEFITKHVDIPIDRDAPPVFTYRLQYTNAKDLTDLLQKITSFGSTTDAGKYGGVRDGIKYFQKMSIVADSWSNSLVINSTPQDFEALKPLIEELDVPQQQVGLEVLFVSVKDIDTKTLGAQISGPNGQGSQVAGASPFGPTFLSSASAQTSGINPGSNIVVTRNSGAGTTGDDFSIKSSLASLLGGNIVNEVGSVLVTFGQPIWAIFKILKSITSTHIISNPFIVVSNNCTATLISGEERRQTSGEVISSSAVKATGLVPIQATLTVNITPQINKDNIINLQIKVQNQTFVSTSNQSNGASRELKEVQTVASVANGETLVLGGIMTENYASSVYGVPLLQNIPILGWFFKSKTRKITRDHFLIFICPRIIDPVNNAEVVDGYTDYKMKELQHNIDLIDDADWFTNSKDPIQKAFFGSKETTRSLQEFKTGNQFATREAIDGKINHKTLPARKKHREKKKEYQRKSKQKKSTVEEKPLPPRNKTSQGVSYVV